MLQLVEPITASDHPYLQGRFQEGHYEISATARLAIHCGLHQIDEDIIMNVLQVPHHTFRPRSFGILGKPKDIMDLSMRIVTFWEVRSRFSAFKEEQCPDGWLGVRHRQERGARERIAARSRRIHVRSEHEDHHHLAQGVGNIHRKSPSSGSNFPGAS